MELHDVGDVLKIDVTFWKQSFDTLERLKTSMTQLQDPLSNPVPPRGLSKEGGTLSPYTTIKFTLKQHLQTSPAVQYCSLCLVLLMQKVLIIAFTGRRVQKRKAKAHWKKKENLDLDI